MFHLWGSDRRGRVAALHPGRVVPIGMTFNGKVAEIVKSPGYLICNAGRTEFLQIAFEFGSFVAVCRWHSSQELACKFNTVVEAITFQDSLEGSDFLENSSFPSFIVRADTLETVL